MEDIQKYDGPFVVDTDANIMSYFFKDGAWFHRNACVQLNLECTKQPPAHVVREWKEKYGPTPPNAKQKIGTGASQCKLFSGGKMEKRKHEEIVRKLSQVVRDSPTTSTPKTPSQSLKMLTRTPSVSKSPMPTPKVKLSSTFETHSAQQSKLLAGDDAESTEKTGPIMVTASEQLIQEARAKFKRTVGPYLYQQLMDRMEIRKMTMEPCEEDESIGTKCRLKPFNPAPNARQEQMLDNQRESEHEKQCGESHEIMAQLLNADEVAAKLKQRKVLQKDILRPVPSRLEGKQSVTLNVEDLASFAAQNDVSILNIDRFITASDQRMPLYNADGNCVFCTVHCVPNAGTHPTADDCPYTFCTCVQCYVAQKCPVLRG